MSFTVVLFFADVQLDLQLCYFFAVVLISCMIPTYNFAVLSSFSQLYIIWFAVVHLFLQLYVGPQIGMNPISVWGLPDLEY